MYEVIYSLSHINQITNCLSELCEKRNSYVENKIPIWCELFKLSSTLKDRSGSITLSRVFYLEFMRTDFMKEILKVWIITAHILGTQ